MADESKSELVAAQETLGDLESGRLLPYPTSRLSPQIIPTDLSTFKSRGIGEVQRFFQQKLREMHEAYVQMVEEFNWNKLIYEAKFGFEPVIGMTYHLYRSERGFALSMIEPSKWPGKKWVGSFRLDATGRWSPQEVAEDFELRDLAGEAEPDSSDFRS